ncbi:hypothetical protein [Sphingomonas endophytica]|uniref:Uncharacterized protein n=1 Tax=Sphingomonas endophytica TaxID=869719 RepID=A0A147I3G0_9SPHN|nr:hypothetical protein [Sphingomonas endophytica]KTT72603.1 hypothetical protein NS334_08385 [Sphingomonas endophytica]
MILLKITSPDGNTTTEEFTPAEMVNWFTTAQRTELETTGRLKMKAGYGTRLIEMVQCPAPVLTDAASRINGVHYLMVTEPGGIEYVMRYGEAEMAEVFTPGQRRHLTTGKGVMIGRCRFVDMVMAARAIAA